MVKGIICTLFIHCKRLIQNKINLFVLQSKGSISLIGTEITMAVLAELWQLRRAMIVLPAPLDPNLFRFRQ